MLPDKKTARFRPAPGYGNAQLYCLRAWLHDRAGVLRTLGASVGAIDLSVKVYSQSFRYSVSDRGMRWLAVRCSAFSRSERIA